MRVLYFVTIATAAAIVNLLMVFLAASAELVQIERDFSQDPGWDHYQNRIIGTDMPIVEQDFGWRRTNHTGHGLGEIGGWVGNSRHQAYYALPLGKPLTFDDEISASGTLALRGIGQRGVGYFGFFNQRRHTWRVWSSMAIRIWEEEGLGQVMFDWMSADWQARGAETAILLKPDGKPHTWRFHYEPEARPDPTWHDALLQQHVTELTGNGAPYELQGEEHLLRRMKQDEPDLTRERLRARLIKARDQGLVEYFHRHNQHRWWKRPEPGKGHGRVTLEFDDHTPYVLWFDEQIRSAPVALDRFGLFNIKRFGEGAEIYFGNLIVNGQKIDLSKNPHWSARNHDVRYTEPNFHAMHNYGWTQTNWAGAATGEIGGLFWRTEPEDPLCSYYADNVGRLTLDDSISFSGSIYFKNGMSDAAVYLGYFNAEDQTRPQVDGDDAALFPQCNMLGVGLMDSSAVGYYFTSLATSRRGSMTRIRGPIFTPDTRAHRYTFEYDAEANEGVGRIKVTFDEKDFTHDLTPAQRQEGATMNRFGFANVRNGGHSVEVYVDDVRYTARREPGQTPPFAKQTYIEVPYPHDQAGRRH